MDLNDENVEFLRIVSETLDLLRVNRLLLLEMRELVGTQCRLIEEERDLIAVRRGILRQRKRLAAALSSRSIEI